MREYVVNRPDAGAMRTLLERESDPEGVIVRLAWLAGLSRDEIAALCWEQVSFMDERLELPDRTIPMTEQLRGYLWRLYQNRKSESLNCTQNIGQIRGIQAIDCIFSR